MDLRVYGRVVRRFKFVVLAGLIVAIALAALTVVRVSPSGKVAYRQAELWSSTTRLGVTQKGFPWGRLFAQQATTGGQALTPAEQAKRLGIPIADPNRLTTLAVLYAELATSDPVKRLMLHAGGPVTGDILANNVVVGDNRIMLPLVDLTAIADSPSAAIALAERSADALMSYVRDQQVANNVPSTDRVILQQVALPEKATVYAPRSKTMPIVVFLAVMLATIGLAFLLENMRPRVLSRGEPADTGLRSAEQRRTA